MVFGRLSLKKNKSKNKFPKNVVYLWGSNSSKNFLRFLIIIIIILGLQLAAASFQLSRYVLDVYDCSDMSEDCEAWFEEIGFDTWLITGERFNGTNHQWIMIDTGLIMIEFESTCLMPISPRLTNNYDKLWISEGWIVDGNIVEDAVFKEW